MIDWMKKLIYTRHVMISFNFSCDIIALKYNLGRNKCGRKRINVKVIWHGHCLMISSGPMVIHRVLEFSLSISGMDWRGIPKSAAWFKKLLLR